MSAVSNKIEQLKQLAKISEVALSSELAKLAKINQQELIPKQKLQELSQKKDRVLAQSDDQLLAADITFSATAKWQAWEANKRQEILRELAQHAQRREQQLEQTRRAFGKKDALQKLLAREKEK